jgi:predicted O-methyltransferase YrrM
MLLRTKLHERITNEIVKSIGIWEVDGMRLAYLASCVGDCGVIVEIGSYRGRSAAYMAAACQDDTRIFCIDVWSNPDGKKFVSTEADLRLLQENLKSLKLDKFVTTIQAASVDAAKNWKIPIDLLFIDGDHSYEGVKTDYLTWSPFVHKGGVIAFHDYHPVNWPGIKKFIDEEASKELKFLGLHERVWSGEK